jgi:AcrR family transcriptional regulator
MPKIWSDTIDSHRRQVSDAVLDATAQLVAEQGPMSVTMSAIAERAGIGRATLYKYFPDVESILVAWHRRDFSSHLERLRTLTDADSVTLDDIAAFVRAQRQHHGPETRAEAVGALAQSVADLGTLNGAVRNEIIDALTKFLQGLAQRHEVRDDQPAEVLARWLFHAIHATADIDDGAVAQLLVDSLAPTTTSRRRTRAGHVAPRPLHRAQD